MIPDYINTKVKRYSPYCLKYNKRHLNFKPQYNYLTTDNERIQVGNFHASDFGLINPKIPVNFFVILRTEKKTNENESIETQKTIRKGSYITYRKLISERLKYLFDNLDEDQDKEIFNLSKNTVNHFIKYIKTTKTPLVSVDNVGNILFEWRDYNNYNIIMLLFKTNDTISLTGIKQDKCVIKVSGIISEVSDAFLRLINE